MQVEGIGPVIGDVAWGGNWFFLVGEHGLDLTLANVDRLTNYSLAYAASAGPAGNYRR